MSVPKPPFHSASEELLYNIYLKLPEISSLTTQDINTLAKLNAILTDADLMKAEEVINALNSIKGDVPDAGNTLEKLYNLLLGLGNLKSEDIDTLAELNAILKDADLVSVSDLEGIVNSIKGNVPVNGETLEKIYNLLQPILSAWVQGGSKAGAVKPIGTIDEFSLPFITNNIERGRFDTLGNFLIGYSHAAHGKVHIRTNDILESNYAAYIEDPLLNLLFGITNTGKLYLNRDGDNLLINGGATGVTGKRNVVLTQGKIGSLLEHGNDNIVIGYDAATTSGVNSTRTITRNVIIGSESLTADNNGTNVADTVAIGYRALYNPGLNAANESVFIGSRAGDSNPIAGSRHVLIGFDAQVARTNQSVVLLGAGARAYNGAGTLDTNAGGLSFMTAIGAGAVVRTANTIKVGRNGDSLIVGSESRGENFNGMIGAIEATQGALNFALGVKGHTRITAGDLSLREGNVFIDLGQYENFALKNAFRLNTYVAGNGGYEFVLSAANANATIEIFDYQFGGTRNEMMRLNPGGYADTGIMMKPDKIYNTKYGYRYLLEGTNASQESRFVSAFHGQITFTADDNKPNVNRVQIFTASAGVTNHFIDGFYADVRGTDPNAQAYAYRSLGSRIFFDGTGMAYTLPVAQITTDSSAHAGATNLMLHGNYVTSAALYINPAGAERTGMIISPSNATANGMFIGSQQALGTYDYDGYLMWLQYSTTGNNMNASTSKPMLLIRKHHAVLNGNDHAGAFIRMEENIGSTGPFIEAYKFDAVSNSLKLKFAVDKDGVISIPQLASDPLNVPQMGRLYFMGDNLKFVSPSGVVRTVKF